MKDIVSRDDAKDKAQVKKMIKDMRAKGKSDDEIKKHFKGKYPSNLLAKMMEASDIGKVIRDLIDTKASDDNKEQGKLVQLLRGLAFSDDPKSNEFMKKLTSMINDQNFGKLAEEDDEDDSDDDNEDEDDDEMEENLTDSEKEEIAGRKEYTAELKAKLRDEDDPEEKKEIKDKFLYHL